MHITELLYSVPYETHAEILNISFHFVSKLPVISFSRNVAVGEVESQRSYLSIQQVLKH